VKTAIGIGVTIGSILGGWLGSLLDHGNMLGLWGILLGGVGGIVGIWAGYKIYKNYIG
jgi:hypothetical protein